MKQLLKYCVAVLLAFLSKAILKKYRPKIVMITGSVGKTSTKDAATAVMKEYTHARGSEKSFNSEFGVPLTIIGAPNPWNNFFRWLRVFESACALLLFKHDYPKILVLEVGADKPGDLKKILSIATPDAVVVTHLPDIPVHVEAYEDPHLVRVEEFSPALSLPPGAPLIICSEDTHAESMASGLDLELIHYGFGKDAQVRIADAEYAYADTVIIGMKAGLVFGKTRSDVIVRGAVGTPQLYAPAAAFALARVLQIPDAVTESGLLKYIPPPGRARILRGISDSIIIDDTYNASPVATIAALDTLARIDGKRHIAVLADMLELGKHSVSEHQRIGESAAHRVFKLVCVGVRAQDIAKSAIEHGMKHEDVLLFSSAGEAILALKPMVEQRDVILVKGSQLMRMENLVKALLKDSDDAKYLCRQEREWQKR